MLERNSIFSPVNVNNGRQFEMDFAKAVSIVLMVFCHVGIYFCEEGTLAYCFFDDIGSECCAPLFMFCMGASFCYSGSSTPKSMLHRGINLFVMAYVLNFFRGFLPEWISSLLGVTPLADGMLEALLMTDILQFAGLAMVVMALFTYRRIHPAIQFFIAILLAAVSDIAAGSSTGSFVADQFLGLFYPISELTCFPLLAWLIFPTGGQLFGMLLKRCTDKKALYRALIAVSGLITLCLHHYSMTDSNYYTMDLYYAMGVKPTILALFAALFMLSCGYFTEGHLPDRLVGLIKRLSSDLNEIYCVSWLLIFWLLLLEKAVLKIALPVWAICILAVGILAASSRIAVRYKAFKKRRRNAPHR